MNHSADPAAAPAIAAGAAAPAAAFQASLTTREQQSPDKLFSALYRELRRLAARELKNGGAWEAMSATTLVHEAFLNMTARKDITFENRDHFLGYATRAMRGLIVDHARSMCAQKRGGGVEVVTLNTDIGERVASPEDLIRIGDLVEELDAVDPELAQVVDLKFFCGFSFRDIADMRGCTERTVQRDWQQARMLLRGMLPDAGASAGKPSAAKA